MRVRLCSHACSCLVACMGGCLRSMVVVLVAYPTHAGFFVALVLVLLVPDLLCYCVYYLRVYVCLSK